MGTKEETSNYGSIVMLFGNGYRLALLTSWVSLLNNLTLSVVWWTLRREMTDTPLCWMSRLVVCGLALFRLMDTLWRSRILR